VQRLFSSITELVEEEDGFVIILIGVSHIYFYNHIMLNVFFI